MRYDGNKVVITESELRWLVNESARKFLNENEVGEGSWGGWKNAWNGAFGKDSNGKRAYNFNIGQTYRSGRDASSFAKYAQQANTAIAGMQKIADAYQNQNVSNALHTVAKNIDSVSKQYTQQAKSVAQGDSKQLGGASNPWAKTQNFDKLQADYDKLNTNYNDLQGQYNTLDTNYADLQGRYNTLDTNYAGLQGQYKDSQKNASDWENKYNGLNQDYTNYKKKYPEQVSQETPERGERPARKWTPSERQALINMGVDPDEYDAKKYPQKQSLGQRFKNGLRKGWQRFRNAGNNNVVPESRRIVTVTPNYIRSLVNETLNILMNEDGGAAGGGGATNAAGVMQGGGTNPGAGQYDVPAFGGKTNKKKADGFGEPIMRQAHNLGDVTQAKVNQVDMGPVLKRKRGGSIAMNRQK